MISATTSRPAVSASGPVSLVLLVVLVLITPLGGSVI